MYALLFAVALLTPASSAHREESPIVPNLTTQEERFRVHFHEVPQGLSDPAPWPGEGMETRVVDPASPEADSFRMLLEKYGVCAADHDACRMTVRTEFDADTLDEHPNQLVVRYIIASSRGRLEGYASRSIKGDVPWRLFLFKDDGFIELSRDSDDYQAQHDIIAALRTMYLQIQKRHQSQK